MHLVGFLYYYIDLLIHIVDTQRGVTSNKRGRRRGCKFHILADLTEMGYELDIASSGCSYGDYIARDRAAGNREMQTEVRKLTHLVGSLCSTI